MKKFFILCCFLFLVFPHVSFAGEEEKACFNILNTAINNDNRFNDPDIFVSWDLSRVLFEEASGSYYNFSEYNQFQDATVINPVRRNAPGILKKLFHARRNNIGTIVSRNNYLVSQIAGFWRDSNFDFPLNPKNGISFGDSYTFWGGFFKEYVLYTHHLNDNSWDFLSCGIVRVIPLDGRSFADISESGYMTNILQWVKNQEILGNKKCSSGFEGSYTSNLWEDFYTMKSNVCVQTYDGSDYLKMEVISVAYDNESSRLNEYITHPLQVEAMKNNSNHAHGLAGIRDVFLQKLYNETCFSVVHGWRLPPRCHRSFWWKDIFKTLLPTAWAALDLWWETLPETEDSGMMVYGNLSYTLYKKIAEIPNEKFRDYLLLSVIPEFDNIVKNKKEQWVILSPYEEVFNSCGIWYTERLENVQDFLTHLDTDTFSLETLSYINPRFWDCIIPYPHQDHRSTVIEGSFLSNQLLARQLNGEYEYADIPTEIEAYAQERQRIFDIYNKNLEELNISFQEGDISLTEFELKKQEIDKQVDDQVENIQIHEIESQKWNTQVPDTSYDFQESQTPINTVYYTLIALCLFLLGMLWLIWIIRYKNTWKK